jgi:DICT domain-containing protein
MEHLSMGVEHQQIEWRRAKVLELRSQGRSQREIADIIQVGIGTVNRDLSYLSKQAQDSLKTHIQERLPEEYQKCITGINQVLKTCWNIANKDTTDDKTKLQATAIINDSYKYLMDLTTNGVVVTDAIKYVQSSREKLKADKEVNNMGSKKPDYNNDSKLEEEIRDTDQTKTVNQIF